MTAVAVRGGWGATGWDDPAMGDVGSVRALSARFQHRADDLRALNVELTQGLAGLGGWHGQAADHFRENQQKLRMGLDEFVVRFERCRTALDSYAHAMDQRRAESNALLPRVLNAKRRLASAQHDILHPPSVEALSRGLTAQPFLIAELEGLGVEWSGIRLRHTGSAGWCAQQLQDSDGNVLQDLFRDVGAVVEQGGHRLKELTEEFHRWLRDNAETINEITSILSTISTAVSVAALFCPALAPVASTLGLAVLVGRTLAWAGGAKGVSWKTVATDAVGVVAPKLVKPGSLAFARYALKSGDLKLALTATELLENQRLLKTGVDVALTGKSVVGDLAPTLKYWTPRYAPDPARLTVPVWNEIENAYGRDLARSAAGQQPMGASR